LRHYTSESHTKNTIRRFNFGQEKARDDDRLLDYVMGLDALLTNKESDLRLRFALRGALVVSLDLAGFRGVFDDLYEAYKQRNDMAHGGDPPETITLGGGEVPIRELADRVEAHMRTIIRAYLSRTGKKKHNLLAELDEIISRGIAGHVPNEAAS